MQLMLPLSHPDKGTAMRRTIIRSNRDSQNNTTLYRKTWHLYST